MNRITMKRILTIGVGFAICGIAGYLTYLQKPRVKTYTTKGYTYVTEDQVKERIVPVKVDNKTINVTVKDTYQAIKPVWDTRTKDVVLNNAPAERLRYWVLLGISVFFGGYNVIVLGLWSRDKFFRKRKSADRVDTSKRLDALLAFYMGTLTGFIAGTDFSDPKTIEVPADSFHLPVSAARDEEAPPPPEPMPASAVPDDDVAPPLEPIEVPAPPAPVP